MTAENWSWVPQTSKNVCWPFTIFGQLAAGSRECIMHVLVWPFLTCVVHFGNVSLKFCFAVEICCVTLPKMSHRRTKLPEIAEKSSPKVKTSRPNNIHATKRKKNCLFYYNKMMLEDVCLRTYIFGMLFKMHLFNHCFYLWYKSENLGVFCTYCS